jgi:hypothetical protein
MIALWTASCGPAANGGPAPAEPAGDDRSTPPASGGPFCGDSARRVLHRADGDHRDACDRVFRSVPEALAAGFLPCDGCRPPMEPPAAEPGPDTACERDDDCAVHVGNCGPGPCGLDWPRALNRERHEWLMRQYAIESCPPYDGPACPVDVGAYLDVRPVCLEGTCSLAYW